jgi:hypothetical protein
MADNQVNVAVNPPVLMFAHLVGKNAGRVVVIRIGACAGWPADILPAFSSIPAARYPAFFDADENFIRDACVQGNAANILLTLLFAG